MESDSDDEYMLFTAAELDASEDRTIVVQPVNGPSISNPQSTKVSGDSIDSLSGSDLSTSSADLGNEDRRPDIPSPHTACSKKDMSMTLKYSKTVCHLLSECKTLKRMTLVPSQPPVGDEGWVRLVRFTISCIASVANQDDVVMCSHFGGETDWQQVFDKIVCHNNIELNKEGLYRHFSFMLADVRMTSVNVTVNGSDFLGKLIQTALQGTVVSEVPGFIWINVKRQGEELLLLEGQSFKLFMNISSSVHNQSKWTLKAAIIKVGEDFESVVISPTNWRKYDKTGTLHLIPNVISSWKQILTQAVSLIYETSDLDCSECYMADMANDLFLEEESEEFFGSDAEYVRGSLGLGDTEKKTEPKRIITIDDELFEDMRRAQVQKEKLEIDFEEEIFDSIRDQVDAHYGRSIVSRNMVDRDVQDIYKFFNTEKTNFVIKTTKGNYAVSAHAKWGNIISLKNGLHFKFKQDLCKVCLRRGYLPEVSYCKIHVRGRPSTVYLLRSKRVRDCMEVKLEVDKPYRRSNNITRFSSIFHTTLYDLKYGLEFFDLSYFVRSEDRINFKAYQEAEEFLLAKQIWNWIFFRYVKRHSGSYFKSFIQLKGGTSIGDMDMLQVGTQLRKIAMTDGFQLDVHQKTEKDEKVMDLDSADCGIWIVRDRTRTWHPTYRTSTYLLSGANSTMYWGIISGKPTVAAYHFEACRQKFILLTGKEIISECCFSTFNKNTGKMLESSAQLASILASAFNIRHLTTGVVPVHLNAKIETFNRVSEGVDCCKLLNIVSLNEFGVRFVLTKL